MSETSWFEASDGKPVYLYRWEPSADPRAVVHIAHGMGEHAGRYDWVAEKLNEAGFLVTADDHRGHGKTAETLGDFGEDGWNRALLDLNEIIERHRKALPGKPVILLGHSMGSMLAQHYITRWSDSLDACVLSGSPGKANAFESLLLRVIVRFERWRVGPKNLSPLLEFLIFGSANKDFEDTVDEPTGFEWLSRDAEQVKAYVEDPLCGFVPCTGSLYDVFAGNREALQKESVAAINASLPLFVFAGDADPVNNGLKNIERLLKGYRANGLEITTRFYEAGRHEMFNEINRDEVMQVLLSWLDGRVTAS